MIRERDIEAYLVKRVEEIGGEVRKLKWIGRNGAPDRLVMYAGPVFVELKRPGEDLEDHQKREHDRMFAKGCEVVMLNSFTAIDYFIGELRARTVR